MRILSFTFALALLCVPTFAMAAGALTFGDPVALSQRSVLAREMGFEFDFRYGLVGDGPTRFVNDLRFAPLSFLELRTSLGPYPDSLVMRLSAGSLRGVGVASAAFGLDKLDLGLRLDPAEREGVKGVVTINSTLGASYDRRLWRRGRLHTLARLDQRYSTLDGFDQRTLLAATSIDVDLERFFGVTVGVGAAGVIDGHAKDYVINMADIGRSGFVALLDREHPVSTGGSFGLTYARTESFDVDVFSTFRVWPEFGALLGAGLRFRL